jgi:catechol 2,3-dioxygenase-like lactoylglutathione lyase family enzyme
MIKGFHHAAISTPDLQRCIDFYTNVIGGEVAWTFGWEQNTPEADEVTGLSNSAAQAAMLKIGETFLEVFEFSSPRPTPRSTERPVNHHGITHICLEVTDINGEYERLKGAGMKFNGPPQSQDGSSMVYGRDPDGNVVELIEFTG